MKKEYRKALRKRFEEALAEAAPEWARVKVDSMYVWPGETLWRRDEGGLAPWVALVPDVKGRDAFTVEIGWSARGGEGRGARSEPQPAPASRSRSFRFRQSPPP